MRVLFFVPRGKFNYKAPWTPLGALSIATCLKRRGHTVLLVDRSFERKPVKRWLRTFAPDAVCVSVPSVRCAADAVKLSAAVKQIGKPVIWGGFFATDYYAACLREGCADYISLGEGEISVCNLIDALEAGTPASRVRGIAFMKNGEPVSTPAEPPADLSAFPPIDFSLCDPKRYLHPYLFCERMMYLYACKGCPGSCTFCSNPAYHCHTFRTRPIEDVIGEIRYLHDRCGMDGVYFSDECWYLKKTDMQTFCRRLEEEDLHIFWGCEMRIGVYDEADLRFMYAHGCRWIYFGVESGDPEMLRRIKKNISIEDTRKTIRACGEIGIAAIASFIIGFPDETPEQLRRTLDFINELSAGVNVCNIFTPVSSSPLCDELIARGEYRLLDSLGALEKTMIGEYSPYRCNTIPYRDLRVIRAHYLWRGFTRKSVQRGSRGFEVMINAVRESIRSLRRMGVFGFLPGLWTIAREFFPVFWYANLYPGTKKKYGLR